MLSICHTFHYVKISTSCNNNNSVVNIILGAKNSLAVSRFLINHSKDAAFPRTHPHIV